MAPHWAELDPELDAIFHDDEPDGPELPRKKVPTGDVYEAARAGDMERLSFWLDLGVNVNARDAWDSVALYYACLAGHLDAAHMLLESGAICSENTFDGDRCHYAALNLRVRRLLKAFEARPPPLAPLPRSLRELFLKSAANLAYLERISRTTEDETAHPSTGPRRSSQVLIVSDESDDLGTDVAFSVAGRVMQAHRAILAARSPYFKTKFETDWKNRKEFRFVSSKLTFAALFSLLHYFYTDRLDVAVDDMEDLVRVCKVCECLSLKKALEKEIAHQKFANYKSLRGVDDSQKRFILQGSSLSWEEQLPAAMRRLFRLCLANSNKESMVTTKNGSNGVERYSGVQHENFGLKVKNHVERSNGNACHDEDGVMTEEMKKERLATSLEASSVRDQKVEFEEDHADVIILVDGQKFRCHRFILAARSEYFQARFARMSENQKACSSTRNGGFGVLPVLEEHDLSAGAFEKLLEYIYTDYVEDIDPDEAEEMFDAASRYLLFPLKRAVVDVLLPHLERTPPAELSRWLLLSDMYGVSKLRDHCLDAMALNFELFASTPEFRQMLKALPPPSGDSEERTTVPSAPGEEGQGGNQGNVLDDLREKWLAIEGEELDQRDESARYFDRRLAELVEIATLEENEFVSREDGNEEEGRER